MNRVVIFRAGYDELAERIPQLLDLLGMNVAPSATVLIKPNILSAVEPEAAVTTHPGMVQALVAAFRGRGTEVWVGDNPGGHDKRLARSAAAAAGILEASDGCFREMGGAVRLADLGPEIGPVAVSEEPFLADVVVSAAKLKTHQLTGLTGAVKNTFGYIPGEGKVRLHRLAGTMERFSKVLADIYALRPPDLAVVDGVLAMEGEGPGRSGTPRRLDLVLAGRDSVAVDAVMARLMGLAPGGIDHLRILAEQGRGEIRMEELTITDLSGDPVAAEPIPDFRLPQGFVSRPPASARFTDERPVPTVDLSVCEVCGVCAESCPAGAIRQGETITIEYEACLECFCCQELCPEGAIGVDLTGPPQG